MKITSHDAEKATIIAVAQAMATAARTAPKAVGIDHIETLILTGEDLLPLADTMEALGKEYDKAFFIRDAGNVRNSSAVLLIGATGGVRGLNDICGYCGSKNCAACISDGNSCVYNTIDMGIAIGSAVAIAADAHIDNRVMFSIGAAALKMNLMDDNVKVLLGIPLSATKKSIYHDRG